MNDREDIDGLAAEYVLGTLDAGERAEVAARRQREHDLDTAIGAWERRLAPLAEAVPPARPPAGLFQKIEARLANAAGSATGTGQVIELERRVRRWRNLAAAASAVAACLLVVIGVREMVRPQTPSSYVAPSTCSNGATSRAGSPSKKPAHSPRVAVSPCASRSISPDCWSRRWPTIRP